ncbi:MAG: tRNA uridine-5-carboxymethylaminomethyl(34) synthesis enzyme MnmG [Candidatus Marinimicrobia bacterium]|nr:tRNA uridine-5-carboxymethylaminomethyl(34) synthesis enzyme MnmG [Candidatus Neomarinimicrobiota bacterium]
MIFSIISSVLFALENRFHVKHFDFDVVVVGGGHAGVEAVHIASTLGSRTALISLDKAAIARMSCNPAIGGLAKGQIVREIDVLGGLMPRISDQAGIQFKMLNKSKGRSVWSPRAQVDKRLYEKNIQLSLAALTNLTIIQGECVDIATEDDRVSGILLRDGSFVSCKSVVLTCGTFLNGLIHIGDRKIRAGRMGEPSSDGITEALVERGFKAGRLKTGTPPRLVKDSINWEKTKMALGDESPAPFSYRTKGFSPINEPCHQTKTSTACHDIILSNIQMSPMYSGDVFGTGPRYCPSIEDKVHRFSHHDSHTLFLEPEWLGSDQIYINGFSTSLPESVQIRALRETPGLESVEFFRPGYAIEYDFFPPSQLKATLESKQISGLFFAGQINGTSGYEEAAVQGLVAGTNAVKHIENKYPLVLRRDTSYTGVLIDDLITKDTMEPYRMFTSRAEYRLLLRFSNTDRRLIETSKSAGLIDDAYYDEIQKKLELTSQVSQALSSSIAPDEINPRLLQAGEAEIKQKTPANKLLMRPSVTITDLPTRLFENISISEIEPYFVWEAYLEAETEIKYDGYIQRQLRQIDRLKHQESFILPVSIDYLSINSLSLEGREKLNNIRPETLGQAMRISGVSPADISILSVVLAKSKR